jgi:hypothetical protein
MHQQLPHEWNLHPLLFHLHLLLLNLHHLLLFHPPTTSNSCVAPNQSAIQPLVSPLTSIISNHHPMITCAKVGICKPRAFCANNYPLPQCYVALLTSSIPREPSSFKAVSLDSHWVFVMTDEYHALLDNQTWTLVPHTSSINVVSYC